MLGDLLTLSDKGFYCASGDFYIDPWQPVPRAVVTHAHADHLVRGCGSYLVSQEGAAVFRLRLGHDAPLQTAAYGESVHINGVSVSLHPAGHILGSAQVRVEHGGEVWVVSGDYKTMGDEKTCTPFEPVRCHTFISEATFALPIYHWRPQQAVFDDLNAWWQQNRDAGRASIVYAYALGKAQRVMSGLNPDIGRIFTHGAVERITRGYRETGIRLPDTTYVGDYMAQAARPDWRGALIIAPLSARGTPWTRKFGDSSSAFVSGWMQIRGARRRRAVDRGFVLSDHADWEGLISAIKATGAAHIGVTHGYIAAFVRWLREQGYDAQGYETRYSDESDDTETEESA
jgi:putative mRNA 3-end processing factor